MDDSVSYDWTNSLLSPLNERRWVKKVNRYTLKEKKKSDTTLSLGYRNAVLCIPPFFHINSKLSSLWPDRLCLLKLHQLPPLIVDLLHMYFFVFFSEINFLMLVFPYVCLLDEIIIMLYVLTSIGMFMNENPEKKKIPFLYIMYEMRLYDYYH